MVVRQECIGKQELLSRNVLFLAYAGEMFRFFLGEEVFFPAERRG